MNCYSRRNTWNGTNPMGNALNGIKTCVPTILFLVLLCGDEFSQYPTLGVRMAEARTREVDASSLITECSNIWPRFPPANQFACYRTRTRSLGPFQTCDATLVRETNITRIPGNENFTQLYVQSPGRLRGRTYNNRLLCRWNVVCGSDQVLYMDVVEHNIEPMQNHSLFRREVCVDYLKAFRDFGTETSCDYRDPFTDLEPREIRLEFRSNTKLRFPGFRMRLACFSPALQNVEGCSPTNDLAVDQRLLRVTRDSKRHTMFEGERVHSMQSGGDTHEIPYQEKYVHFFDEVSPVVQIQRGRRIKRYTVRQFKIDRTATLFFLDRVLLVFANESVVLYKFHDIDTVHTYNVYEGIDTFQSNPKVKQTFRGRGVLTVTGNAAFFVVFGVDLSQFQPSVNETIAIRVLMDAEAKMLNLPSEDFIIKDENPSSSYDPTPILKSVLRREESPDEKSSHSFAAPTPDSTHSLGSTIIRGKRQAGVLEPEVMEAAQRGANSCNAILRGIAQSLLSLTN